MSLKYELSSLAGEDLERIWLYTYETWSITQADFYYNLILDEIEKLCNHPEIGRTIEKVKRDHRIREVKSHLIIYKIKNDIIYVDRILHQRMDIESQLSE